jgi:hypothetical protein
LHSHRASVAIVSASSKVRRDHAQQSSPSQEGSEPHEREHEVRRARRPARSERSDRAIKARHEPAILAVDDDVCTTPDDLLVRLVAAVPPPRWHLLRYFGVISSHSRLRREVVPHPPSDPSATAPPPAPGDQVELALDADHDEPAPRKRWAWLLRHVFKADLDTCPRCGGGMRWAEAAASKDEARDLLARLGLGPRPPPAPKPPPLGQLTLPFTR